MRANIIYIFIQNNTIKTILYVYLILDNNAWIIRKLLK